MDKHIEDLLFTISEIVNFKDRGSYTEIKQEMIDQAKLEGLLTELNEFLSWFDAPEIEE